jgi:hypothetical protein
MDVPLLQTIFSFPSNMTQEWKQYRSLEGNRYPIEGNVQYRLDMVPID